MNDEEFFSLFPYPKERPGQKELTEKIIEKFESGIKFVMLELPTGYGKSAIGYTVGNYFKELYYITANKILQTQLSSDYSETGRWIKNGFHFIELKGRNAYPCNYYQRALSGDLGDFSQYQLDNFKEKSLSGVSCADGECKRHGKSKLKECNGYCPYYNQKEKARLNNAVLMNFHSFIFQTEYGGEWPLKKLLIIDEGHLTEQVLMDFVTIRFEDLPFGVVFPKFESAEECSLFFDDNDFSGKIQENLDAAIAKGDNDKEEYWTSMAIKLINFKKSISSDADEWIVKNEDHDKWRTVEIKPLFIRNYTNKLLFDKVDCVLIMSATIISPAVMRDSLGISKEDCWAATRDSIFPVKNRPIYYKPCGSMSFKNKNETMPKILKEVEELCERYNDVKGIIHSHSNELTKYIVENSSNYLKSRLLSSLDFGGNKDFLMEEHKKRNNSIIISPGMAEGISLNDELSRMQILVKVPFPGLGNNEQLKQRMNLSPSYYDWLCCLKLVQSIGRSVRSETDYADTYILDSDFKFFYNKAKNMIPKWIKEAIIW
jgi:Rad3-related DNA helicase